MTDAAKHYSLLTLGRSRWMFAILAIAGIINGLVGAWIVTAGPNDPVAHTAIFLSFLVSPWMLATYAVTLCLLGLGAWRLRRLPRLAPERPLETTMRRRGIQFAIVLALAATSLSGIGYLYVRDFAATTYADRAAEQQLVSRFKAQQVGKWLFETTVNAEIMAASLARMPVDRLPGDRDVAQVMGLLFAEALAGNPERMALTLFSPKGEVLVHEGEGAGPDAATRQAAQAAAANGAAPRIVDMHNEPGDPPRPRMAVLVPVAVSPGAPPLGWLAIALDPFRGVLDKFSAWPTPSAISEVLLVHRVGDEVVYIVPPSFVSPPPPPNTFSLPISNTQLPAVQALLSGPGIHPGIDYRGNSVVTAFDRVNGLPWYVGAKTDEAAYLIPVRNLARRLALVIGAGIVLTIVCIGVLFFGERAALRGQAERADLEHEALSRHFEDLARQARDVVILTDSQGRIIEANLAATRVYGYTLDEFRDLQARDLRPPESQSDFARDWERYNTPDGTLLETLHRRKDGSTFPVEVSGRVMQIGGRPFYQAFVRDISVRRGLERQVARLSRVRTALQAGTSVLLRAPYESEMYERLCGVLVREGGYLMANVAMPIDDPARSVQFVAVAGRDDGYLAQARISWGDGPRGQGPTGTALRTGEIQVNQDFIKNPLAAPWREEALKRGFRSSIALPLRDGDRTFAALTLYASEADAFDDDEVALLSTLSGDLAFAAAAARRRRAA